MAGSVRAVLLDEGLAPAGRDRLDGWLAADPASGAGDATIAAATEIVLRRLTSG
ncbi:MAG: hypothetical protein ACFCVG_06225 [Kineosporiaceae bacterium]